MEFYLDVREIPGTNCYLDHEAGLKIRELISAHDINGIHFFGSGNYHYISYLYLERISEDFNLLVFDNHPDMLEPAFGNILSCGSWVRQALLDFHHLKNVYICGASKEHIKEEQPFPKNAHAINPGDLSQHIPDNLPLYISIDKDVLSPKFASTDWDQGEMTVDELLYSIDTIGSYHIIGADICGDKKSGPFGPDSNNTDSVILKSSALSKLTSF